MANVGRFICVALPFILTLLSLITLLVACLGGVANKSLYNFQVDMSELSISPDAIRGAIGDAIGDALNGRDLIDDVTDLIDGDGDDVQGDVADAAADLVGGSSGSNVTAADLGLQAHWDVGIWGYCTSDEDGKDRKCTKPKYNWAATKLDTEILDKLRNYSGGAIEIPDEITKALDAFVTVSRWTQIVFIVALVSLGVQLVIGMFATCTRIASCLTFLVAGVSSTAVCIAASLSTATAGVVIGAVKGTAKVYGVDGAFNTTFLGLVWASAAFAMGAGLFWLFTICCCAPDHSKKRSKKGGDAEKFASTSSYAPLQDQNDPFGQRNSHYGQQQQYGAPRYPSGASATRSQMAYEPYSHR